MESPWLVTWLIVALGALVQAVLLSLQAWEHRRFAKSRIRKPAASDPGAPGRRVVLFAPCKGLDLGFEENIRPLLEQDYQNYEVTFIVESADDAAYEPIRRLLARYPAVRAEVLVAGRATDTGQKVHNLRQATQRLRPEIEILAFVDSDARPRRDWLRLLVRRLDEPGSGAVTGYRWFVPARPTWANSLLYSINCTVAALFGPGGHHVIWGGSWAIRRDVFEASRLREAWQGKASDDLVATRVLRRRRLAIEFEPACMLASPLETDWRGTVRFLRRQYLIGRFYLPGWWTAAFLSATLVNVGFWGGLVMLAVGAAAGAPWTWLPASVCALWYALSLFRGRMRRDLSRLYLPEHQTALAAVSRFDTWAGPLVVLANWLGIASSLFGRRIDWRGITYQFRRGGQVRLVWQRTSSGPT